MIAIKNFIVLTAIAVTTLAACSMPVKEKDQVAGEDLSKEISTNNLPDFIIQDAAGKSFNLQTLKGKKVFVNLWASWCPPCRSEMPSIAALYSKVNTDKTVFIMLSLDENFESSLNFLKENQLSLPVYFPGQQLPALFNTDGIPATFIFNENGELTKQNNGADDYDTDEYLQILK